MSRQNQKETKSIGNEVNITYMFNAERELVFNAWTDPDQLKEWYAPTGCTILFKTIDVREGGTFHSCISNPTFGNCWCKGSYQEVVFPERIVFSMEITDEHGGTVHPIDVGMDAEWPRITIVTVTFREINGKTEVNLHQTVSESLAKKTGAHPSWIQILENLQKQVLVKSV